MSRVCLSLSVRCAWLLFLPVALPNATQTYQQPDLQGRWESNSIASGPGAPWWERALATITPSGSFTALTNDNSGGSGTVLGTLNLSPAGIATRTGVGTFRAALDQGTIVFAGTDTWSGFGAGTTELRVSLKMAPTYAPSDLVGAWEVNSIASGPGAPWWQRGRVAVAANGSFSGTFIDSDGFSDPASPIWSVRGTSTGWRPDLARRGGREATSRSPRMAASPVRTPKAVARPARPAAHSASRRRVSSRVQDRAALAACWTQTRP